MITVTNTWLRIGIVVLASACEWGGGPGPAAYLSTADAPKGRFDASGAVDAPTDGSTVTTPDGPAGTGHLLLTEITLAPTGSEFVEIYNPLPDAIDLSTYYLSNHGSYFKLPAGAPALPSGHFIVHFDAGASIASGEVITVATGTAAAFDAAYGSEPTYSITDGTIAKVAATGTPSLTDTGTVVVLFSWDGSSPLVSDVDIMIAGKPTAASQLISKSGYSQKGATYATDADTIAAQTSTPGSGKSTKRIKVEAGYETQAGTGNGITGHDETSEDTAKTWDTTFTAPTPGQVPTL